MYLSKYIRWNNFLLYQTAPRLLRCTKINFITLLSMRNLTIRRLLNCFFYIALYSTIQRIFSLEQILMAAKFPNNYSLICTLKRSNSSRSFKSNYAGDINTWISLRWFILNKIQCIRFIDTSHMVVYNEYINIQLNSHYQRLRDMTVCLLKPSHFKRSWFMPAILYKKLNTYYEVNIR